MLTLYNTRTYKTMSIELHKVDFKKYLLSKHADDIRCIASPLKRLANISHFSYQKTSTNEKQQKEQVFFTTHPSFTEDVFIPEKFYEIAFCGDTNKYTDNFYLWDCFEGNVVHKAAAENLRLKNGLTIVKQKNNYCEFYFFATRDRNPMVNLFFVHNIDLFESFILYFKDKAKVLLAQAENNKVILPTSANDTTIIPAQKYLKTISSKIKRNAVGKFNKQFISLYTKRNDTSEFIDFYNICQHTNFNLTSKTSLSKREQQCANYLLEGLTAKEIAELLNISYRTVEVYLDRLKKRFGSKNKIQLVKQLLDIDHLGHNTPRF